MREEEDTMRKNKDNGTEIAGSSNHPFHLRPFASEFRTV